MKDYSKRIESLKCDIDAAEKKKEKAQKEGKKHVVRRLSLMIESMKKKINNWSQL